MWYTLAAILMNPVIVVAPTRMIGGQPVGPHRLQLAAAGYPIVFAALSVFSDRVRHGRRDRRRVTLDAEPAPAPGWAAPPQRCALDRVAAVGATSARRSIAVPHRTSRQGDSARPDEDLPSRDVAERFVEAVVVEPRHLSGNAQPM